VLAITAGASVAMTQSLNAVDISVGVRVRNLRLARGLSDADAALNLQITPVDYQRLESGLKRFTAGQLQSLSALLRVNAAAFFVEFCKPLFVVANSGEIRIPPKTI